MSPRAACRLETLGAREVYDYVLGKVDWLAHRLPVEGERAEPPTAGRFARDDVVRCGLRERLSDVRKAIEESPYDFALVTSQGGVVLGRVAAGTIESEPDRTLEEVMEPGPSTVRPHRSAGGVAQRLADQGSDWAIVTTPEGRLIGVAARADLERAE